MSMSITDERDSSHQSDNTFIVGQARDDGVETRDFLSKAFSGNGVKSIDMAERKFSGKITKVCGRVLRCARSQKNGER